MRVVLFGGGNKGTVILNKLIEMKQDIVGVFYFKEDKHENIWYHKVQDAAKYNHIPTYGYMGNLLIQSVLESLKPDVVFVVGWRYKISKDIYSIPPKGTIVFHDSLLPKYRGFAPMNWAIINGEMETGATMFYIADDIDGGDIIAQKLVEIEPDDTAKIVESKVAQKYVDLIAENLSLIENGKITRTPQDNSEATYTCKRTPSDGLIDWNKSAKQIYDLVRGLSDPYPNAFTYLDGHKVYINEVRGWDNLKTYAGCVCGRVIDLKDGVKVLTGDGVITISKIKVDGGICHPASEVVKSIKSTFRSA